MIEYPFVLRDTEGLARIALPSTELTQYDADRLSAFIQALVTVPDAEPESLPEQEPT